MNTINKKETINQPMINPGVSQNLSYMTQAPLTKWGNSQGIRIPRAIMDIMKMKINDTVEMKVQGNELIISKKQQYKNLTERLESFYQRPIEDIFVENKEELDWGTPEGDETW